MLRLVGGREIGIVVSWWDAAFWFSLVLWTALMVRTPSRACRWVAAFTPLVVLCPLNLLGGIAAVYDWLLVPSDGEMLAEHWPVLHAYAAWILLAAVTPFLVTYFHARHARAAAGQLSPTEAKAPPNKEMQLTSTRPPATARACS